MAANKDVRVFSDFFSESDAGMGPFSLLEENGVGVDEIDILPSGHGTTYIKIVIHDNILYNMCIFISKHR